MHMAVGLLLLPFPTGVPCAKPIHPTLGHCAIIINRRYAIN